MCVMSVTLLYQRCFCYHADKKQLDISDLSLKSASVIVMITFNVKSLKEVTKSGQKK